MSHGSVRQQEVILEDGQDVSPGTSGGDGVRTHDLRAVRLQRLFVIVVTKRCSGWACIGTPKLGQESIKGTHARETPAYQRRPTTLHEGQGSNPPITALYMQLAKIPHIHHTTMRTTITPSADKRLFVMGFDSMGQSRATLRHTFSHGSLSAATAAASVNDSLLA